MEKMLLESNKTWKIRIFIFAWIGYALFYLCRANFSLAIPQIIEEFGFTKTELGAVGSALFAMYAIGQFVNGQLGDLLGARRLVTIGIIFSALANLAFGFAGGLVTMMIVWGINGYFQSMGWSPNVKLIGNWFVKDRGKVMGFFGSCYQVGNAGSWLLAGYLASNHGWRYVFWVPSVIFGLSSIMYYVAIRDNPDNPTEKVKSIGLKATLKGTIISKEIWLIALAFFFVDIVRYGFFVWAPTFLFEVQNATISSASLKVAIIPIAGSLGAIMSGWISQQYLKNRRAIVASILLACLGIFSWLYLIIPINMWELGLFTFVLIGFCTYGSHVTMVATMPVDFSIKGGSASAAGFIDGFGYLGATIVSIVSGILIDNFGWDYAFGFWILSAFIASVLLLPLWRRKPIK